MTISIITENNKITVNVPNMTESSKECWELQGKEIFEKCLNYILSKEKEVKSFCGTKAELDDLIDDMETKI